MPSAILAPVAAILLTAAAPPVGPAGNGPPADSVAATPAQPDSAAAETVVTLYYFHRTTRCETCLAIEGLIDETVRAHFADAIETRRLSWQAVNVEAPGNEHFVGEFALEANAAILVAPASDPHGQPWQELDKVWELVGNREEFVEYIRDRVDAALGTAATGK